MNIRSATMLILRRLRRRIKPSQYKEHYVQEALDPLGAQVYLEIGVRQGDSFRCIKATEKVGVDPCRTAEMAVLREGETFYEMTSDEFFSGPAADLFARKPIGVCLVDGLHTFEQSLADVLNAAKFLHRDGTIVLDDVYPDTEDKAALAPHGRAWNGDVWKTMAVLRSTQPEWEVFSIPVDEGVGMVRPHGHPANPITADDIRRYKELPYEALRSNPHLIGVVTDSR